MPKMKITVVKAFSAEEVFDGEVPDHFPETFESPCPMHPVGQEFVMENLNCPEGFCNWAYDDIYRDMAHLWMDGDFSFIGKPGTMFSSCTDGKKPVIFRLE
ncbi:MAG: TIGR04076 family protein, partial [Candidatus Bathyarchaeota archaeon]